jgi:hypothetical protein
MPAQTGEEPEAVSRAEAKRRKCLAAGDLEGAAAAEVSLLAAVLDAQFGSARVDADQGLIAVQARVPAPRPRDGCPFNRVFLISSLGFFIMLLAARSMHSAAALTPTKASSPFRHGFDAPTNKPSGISSSGCPEGIEEVLRASPLEKGILHALHPLQQALLGSRKTERSCGDVLFSILVIVAWYSVHFCVTSSQTKCSFLRNRSLQDPRDGHQECWLRV